MLRGARSLAVLSVSTVLMLVFAMPSRADSVDIGEPGPGIYEGRWNRNPVDSPSSRERQPPRGKGTKLTRTIAMDRDLSKRRGAAFVVMCREATEAGISCVSAPERRRRPSIGEAIVDLSSVARTLITRIQLPNPAPRIGPDPSVNEWKMAAVGYPLWLWTDGPGVVTDRVRAYGVTFTLRARWVSTSFDMGDGHRVTCSRTQPYQPAVEPGTRSPVCGYTYTRSSLPKGHYTVTATTNWQVSWSALGLSGSLPASFSGTRALPVGELNALVVR